MSVLCSAPRYTPTDIDVFLNYGIDKFRQTAYRSLISTGLIMLRRLDISVSPINNILNAFGERVIEK